MADIRPEIQANYDAYVATLSASLVQNLDTFRGKQKLVESYARLSAFNSLKVDLVDVNFPSAAARFFHEAHNDGLLSLVNASIGSWRPALQALRSTMENTLSAVYYSEHPVELQKWSEGRFFIQPKQLREYIADHPKILPFANLIDLKGSLDAEYGTLSKAVHASNSLFRMSSNDGKTVTNNPDVAELGKWSTREKNTLSLCSSIMVAFFSEHLDGAKQPKMRTALAPAIFTASKEALKEAYSVRI